MSDIVVRFADGDNDVVAIHGFLCVTMGPMLPYPIDPKNSATEVWRVVNQECALMAMRGDLLVGTIGIVRAPFWWAAERHFLANRWGVALPDSRALDPLLRAAVSFAKSIASAGDPGGLEFHFYDEQKGRLKIFNRHPRRLDFNPILLPVTRPETTTLQ